MKNKLTAENLAEIATFKPTGKTVTHRGRVLEIFLPPDDEKASHCPYILKSPRGQWYGLTRNKPKPHLLFGIGFYEGMRILPGWFSDQSGEVISIG